MFRDGQPSKAEYRRYRIREAAPDDDLACLREVFARRLARVESEPLPDLMLVDGGKGQLSVLSAALADAGLETDAISLAKERDTESPSPRVRRSGGLKSERVFVPNRRDPVSLPASSRALLLLQRIRDESHRFAIEFQRELRSKAGLVSILEEIPGIGPGKRRALLRELGSLRAVRSASLESLAAVSGISRARRRDAAGFLRRPGGGPRARSGGPPRRIRGKARPRAIRFPRRGSACAAGPAGSASRSLLAPLAAAAEIYQWTDEQGRVHFTQDLSQVPARHRSQAELRALAPPEAGPLPDLQPAGGAGTRRRVPRSGGARRGARSGCRWPGPAPG